MILSAAVSGAVVALVAVALVLLKHRCKRRAIYDPEARKFVCNRLNLTPNTSGILLYHNCW